jgi:hypothetical protein
MSRALMLPTQMANPRRFAGLIAVVALLGGPFEMLLTDGRRC